MRLIYVDNINFHCNYNGDFTGDIEDCKECENYICDFRDIQEQPTAYDIDKVVEELESFAKLAEDRWTNGTSKHAYQEHKCWVKAIEIVKQGGVSDDVCEWQSDCHLENDNPAEWLISPHNPKRIFSTDIIYCPYCGKKIKVVE